MEITFEEWVPDATDMVASGTVVLGKSFLLSMFPVGTISLLSATLEGVECRSGSLNAC